MKTAKLMVATIFGVSLALHADPLLYWMVDGSDNTGVTFDIAALAYTSQPTSIDAAQLEHVGYVPLVSEQSGSAPTAIAASSGNKSTLATWADLETVGGASTTYSFFVELLSWDGSAYQRVGQSAAMSYSDLASSGHVLASSLDIAHASLAVWHPVVGVPEPTSGLLMLIGGSLLALRRRRKVA